jgi:hypothetical protein
MWADCPPVGIMFANVSQWGAHHLNYLWAHQYISPLPPQAGALARRVRFCPNRSTFRYQEDFRPSGGR